jgi:hypothetical protein
LLFWCEEFLFLLLSLNSHSDFVTDMHNNKQQQTKGAVGAVVCIKKYREWSIHSRFWWEMINKKEKQVLLACRLR